MERRLEVRLERLMDDAVLDPEHLVAEAIITCGAAAGCVAAYWTQKIRGSGH